MQKIPVSFFLALLTVVFLTGCEIDDTMSQVPPAQSQAPTSNDNNNQPDEPANDDDEPSPTPTPSASPTPTPEPAASPTPAPVTGGAFLWQPGASSVRLVIPAHTPHWQLHVFSRRKHATLYGPDNRGGNRDMNIEYTLPGGGADWQRKSVAAGDDGSLLVFINTRDSETGPYKSAGWRIMSPTATVSGDGSRIAPGEDK